MRRAPGARPARRPDRRLLVRRRLDRAPTTSVDDCTPRTPRGPFGRPRLERSAAARDRARHAGADGPRTEPVPRLRRHVGRMGRLRPAGRRLARAREADAGRREGGARDGAQLCRISPLAPSLLLRLGPAGDVRRARLDARGALLPPRLRRDGGRLAGCAREPHRGGLHRARSGGRRERAAPLRGSDLQAVEPAARRGRPRDEDERPEQLAAARARPHRGAERHPAARERAVVRRSALGPRARPSRCRLRTPASRSTRGAPPKLELRRRPRVQARRARRHPPQRRARSPQTA